MKIKFFSQLKQLVRENSDCGKLIVEFANSLGQGEPIDTVEDALNWIESCGGRNRAKRLINKFQQNKL